MKKIISSIFLIIFVSSTNILYAAESMVAQVNGMMCIRDSFFSLFLKSNLILEVENLKQLVGFYLTILGFLVFFFPNKIKNIWSCGWNNSKPKPFIPSKTFI